MFPIELFTQSFLSGMGVVMGGWLGLKIASGIFGPINCNINFQNKPVQRTHTIIEP
jgi:hypothetical protein